MIETMNEQQVKLANCMREYDLSHETDLRVNFSELDVNLCDDGASSLTLESGLEEVLDPPLTTLPLVAPSPPSILRDYTPLCMTYPNPPFHLAQSMEFEVVRYFVLMRVLIRMIYVVRQMMLSLRCMILMRLS